MCETTWYTCQSVQYDCSVHPPGVEALQVARQAVEFALLVRLDPGIRVRRCCSHSRKLYWPEERSPRRDLDHRRREVFAARHTLGIHHRDFLKPERVLPVALHLAPQDATGETGTAFDAVQSTIVPGRRRAMTRGNSLKEQAMARPIVVFNCARNYPPGSLESDMPRLMDTCEVRLTEARDGPDLARALADAQVLVARRDYVGRNTLSLADGLRGVVTPGVGIEKVDVAAATDLGIVVANSPGNSITMSEATLLLMLAVAKQMPRGSKRRARAPNRRSACAAWSCTARRSASSASDASDGWSRVSPAPSACGSWRTTRTSPRATWRS